ncbi:unnamed protein product [Clonostachys rosea f. rosea IK726]|uniref:Uncharacterized protein n=1 Tax=Clonostachys rosea f. rosea IK726 TaxID=1349383 RepID=A0ACA9UHX4_BIOOC|nr:unnamed protein product [Clonostachys rosea f. rosea IK726]
MSTRRSHPKSRKGCITCKTRHVKCDEQGPPCGRCQARGTKCQYASPSNQQSDSPATTIARSTAESNPGSTAESNKRNVVAFPATRHLLELQLMHRWSALTYKSCLTPGSDDDDVWQFMVPGLAVQHDYLLYGIFALSAFETARIIKTPDAQMYVNAAVEYHGLALSRFQSQLPGINAETHEAALCMSLMLLCLACASAQVSPSQDEGEKGRMVEAVVSHFGLLRGCIPILNIDPGYASRNVYIQKLTLFEDLPRIPISPELEANLSKLNDLNDKRITTTVRDSDERRVQQVAYWDSCKKALAILRECYEKCVDDLSKGYALGWPNLAGEEYMRAIEEKDSVSLSILMYWGVLAHKLGHQVWWAEDFGSLLVAEVAKSLAVSEDGAQYKDVIECAQLLVKEER